jgi:hypothetical protein
MLSYLSKTISTLCHDLAAMHDPTDTGRTRASYDDITEFVFEQLQKMPVFLSRPILLATAIFGMSRFLIEGSVFHKRLQEQRRLQVENWRRSRFGPSRELLKFYTSLVILALYSRGGIGKQKTTNDA